MPEIVKDDSVTQVEGDDEKKPEVKAPALATVETKPPIVKPATDPKVENNPNTPAPNVNAITGVWALAISQSPRSCSAFYDLRDTRSVKITLLCQSLTGNSLSLQSDIFARQNDDGKKAQWKRISSTCPNASMGLMNMTYTLDANQNLVITEGFVPSPSLAAIKESRLAGDFQSARTLYGRAVVRGCFRSGNLQTFVAGAAQ